MPRQWWLLLLALIGSVQADDLALVPAGASWRWWAGRAEPSTPTDAWRQAGFNDQLWPRGASGFGFDSGAGEYTTIPGPRDYVALYLRAAFEVANPASIRWLTLRVDFEGGFVAFLNGTEVARRGMPGEAGDPVPFNTPAEVRFTDGPEEIDLSAFAGALHPGTNVLALQWHSSLPLTWGVHLVPELRGNFTRGPVVQNVGTNSAQFTWRTRQPTDSILEYGPTAGLGFRVQDPTLTTNHVVTVNGLTPDAPCFYRSAATTDGPAAASPIYSFRTARAQGPFSFTVMADVGSGNVNQHTMAAVARATNPDLMLVAGDLVYPRFNESLADFRFFSVYEPHMRSCPYYVVAGNHDYNYGIPAQFYDSFCLPTNSVSPAEHAAAGTFPEAYYSFDHGDGHFVGLFVPLMDRYTALTANSAQMRWLIADLAASTKPWKFLFLHHPLHSSNVHRHDDYNLNGIDDQVEVAALLLPVARQYGVQLIFSGHDHGYERFVPVDGVHLVVSAAAGGQIYALTELDPLSAYFSLGQNCVNVRVDGDTLEYRGVGLNGQVFDRMFLQRQPPPPTPGRATWHTPVIESTPANDGDGNVTGQSFDFAGAGLPTASGDFSNLGRVHVNQDHDFLYVGFEEVMLGADANLFLFIESPGLPGVSTMEGLGNGLIDPLGEGVDGLDFLENLSFTDFTPGIACVLGDEYADRTTRSFLRTNVLPPTAFPPRPADAPQLDLDIGQGVFRLDPEFSSVPGARLQQFNQSPQTFPFRGEQNANFIEVAIPLAELHARPGDRLRLGAVVGGGGFSTNANAATRFLDRSYFGARLVGAGSGPVQLEGLIVDLGPDLDPDGDGLTDEQEGALGTDPRQSDSDGDGLLDGWEVRYGLNPRQAGGDDGAAGDPDHDGFPNLAEQAAGTHPRDARSALRLKVTPAGKGRLRFDWPARPGARYQLEFALRPGAPFEAIIAPGLPVTAEFDQAGIDLDLGPEAASASRFFRLQLLP